MIQRIAYPGIEEKAYASKIKLNVRRWIDYFAESGSQMGASFDQKVMEIAPENKLFILLLISLKAKKPTILSGLIASDVKSLNNFSER